MEPGAYVDPLIRTTWVQVPMVSGYVGSRLRVADYSFGTDISGGNGTNTPMNSVRLFIENTATTSAGTNIYFRVQQAPDDGASTPRTYITPEYGVVPLGAKTVDFFIDASIIEIKCTGGTGNIRAQVISRLKWEQMALDRKDPFGAPQLFNQKFITGGVVAPSPFPTS